jgi:MFS family permease
LKHGLRSVLTTTVIIGALGYFVDIYDLVLFSIVRVPSLKSLGIPPEQLEAVGIRLLNTQMTGMLLGGILWGVLGDKKGRVSVLFGSILMYSLANIANGVIGWMRLDDPVGAYAWLRFIAGIGLAGELGAAITLVAETLPKDRRGLGTSVVAGIGVSGAITAGLIGEFFSWQLAYVVGGVLGLMLLVARLRMFDSGMFESLKGKAGVSRGNLLVLLGSRRRLLRYANCILIGLPIWFVIGILVTFSREICADLGATGPVSPGIAIMFAYGGLVIGDISSGLVSQWLRSRKNAVAAFLAGTVVSVLVYLTSRDQAPGYYYFICLLMGTAVGYWAMFVTIAAEQFGTNLRATVATTVPNFVRGAVVLITLSFKSLSADYGRIVAAGMVGAACCALAGIALWRIEESFHRDLDFLEE